MKGTRGEMFVSGHKHFPALRVTKGMRGRARRSFGCAIVSLLGRVWGMRVDGIEGNECGWGEVGNGG